MTTLTPTQQQQALQRDKLQQELTPTICHGLEDDDVIEIMANPNGEIWFDRLSCGVERTGIVFSETRSKRSLARSRIGMVWSSIAKRRACGPNCRSMAHDFRDCSVPYHRRPLLSVSISSR